MNSREEYLSKHIKTLAAQDGVFIAGPQYEGKHLRVYAHGGFLCGLPLLSNHAYPRRFDPNYIDTDKKLAAAFGIAVRRPDGENRFHGERGTVGGDIRFYPHWLDVLTKEENLLPLLEKIKASFSASAGAKGEDEPEERRLQTYIARNHRSFAKNSGALVCDYESSIPKKALYPGKANPNSAEFDLVAFSLLPENKAELTVIEYKCNRSACENKSGIKKHAADMLALNDKAAKAVYIKEILRRFHAMCSAPYGIVEAQPEGLLDLLAYLMDHPDAVTLRYAFLFTKGPDLDGSIVKDICEKQLGDHCGSFLYQYRDSFKDVDLSDFKPWDAF